MRGQQDDDGERVSLAPLNPLDALRALLTVDPDAEPVDAQQPDDFYVVETTDGRYLGGNGAWQATVGTAEQFPNESMAETAVRPDDTPCMVKRLTAFPRSS